MINSIKLAEPMSPVQGYSKETQADPSTAGQFSSMLAESSKGGDQTETKAQPSEQESVVNSNPNHSTEKTDKPSEEANQQMVENPIPWNGFFAAMNLQNLVPMENLVVNPPVEASTVKQAEGVQTAAPIQQVEALVTPVQSQVIQPPVNELLQMTGQSVNMEKPIASSEAPQQAQQSVPLEGLPQTAPVQINQAAEPVLPNQVQTLVQQPSGQHPVEAPVIPLQAVVMQQASPENPSAPVSVNHQAEGLEPQVPLAQPVIAHSPEVQHDAMQQKGEQTEKPQVPVQGSETKTQPAVELGQAEPAKVASQPSTTEQQVEQKQTDDQPTQPLKVQVSEESETTQPKVVEAPTAGVETISADKLPAFAAARTESQAAVQTEGAKEVPVYHQLQEQIMANIKAEKSEFQMQLYPKDLGKVTVKMAVEHGVLVVEMSAANPKTQSLLLANSDEIRSILQMQTGNPAQITVATPDKPYYQQNQEQASQHQQQNQEASQKEEHQDDSKELFTNDFLAAVNLVRSKLK